jgi:hypothetical protein
MNELAGPAWPIGVDQDQRAGTGALAVDVDDEAASADE